MPAQQNARDRLDRERRDEAERIAIRMGFHSAFVRATAAEGVAAEHARAHRSRRAGRGARRMSAG